MQRLEFPNEAVWRFWRIRRAFGLLRWGLLGVFAAVLIHVLAP